MKKTRLLVALTLALSLIFAGGVGAMARELLLAHDALPTVTLTENSSAFFSYNRDTGLFDNF
ncbi:MAG: hypothetical protein RSC08_06380, partial [Oscillospiraceae bacterium]